MPREPTHEKAQDAAAGRSSAGLTSEEARRRLQEFGPNASPETTPSAWRAALGKFWAPVPWMLEATIVLQLALGEYAEAAVIAVLLAFNAALGFLQESRAQATLKALKARLALFAVARRDGRGGRCRSPNWCPATSSSCRSAASSARMCA